MMYRFLSFLFVLPALSSHAQQGIQYLKAMHTKNYGHWYGTMTFVQTTEVYRNDSLFRKSTWYEALKLPYDLRIDIEDPANGNFILYKKDSSYRFQNHALRAARADVNPFIFFIGGMYYVPFDSVLNQLKNKGYDVTKGYATQLEGNAVYVVGRSNDKDSGNAIWIDTKNLWFVRLIETENGQTIDAFMRDHKQLPKGSTETKVDIYINGKLVQVERYDQVETDVKLDSALFDPATAADAKHWHQ